MLRGKTSPQKAGVRGRGVPGSFRLAELNWHRTSAEIIQRMAPKLVPNWQAVSIWSRKGIAGLDSAASQSPRTQSGGSVCVWPSSLSISHTGVGLIWASLSLSEGAQPARALATEQEKTWRDFLLGRRGQARIRRPINLKRVRLGRRRTRRRSIARLCRRLARNKRESAARWKRMCWRGC